MTGTGSKQALAQNSEDRQERSSALKVIGLGLIVAGMLVFFFLPAGEKLGQERGFITIISAMVLAGLVLIIVGAVRGAKNSN